MRIADHRIEGAPYKASPNHGGTLVSPTLLVMHFTASGRSAEADLNYFASAAAKASAHVITARDGKHFQSVPFNVKAWHAGKSTWRGKANCNDFSIGIEVDNWGILTKRANGKFYSWTGEEVPADEVVELTNKRGVKAYWHTYTAAQLNALDDLVQVILMEYPSIKEVVGHEDIAPGRKTDPGPAFPLQRYANMVEGRGGADVNQTRTVIASSLNLRAGPGVGHPIEGAVTKGTRVEVLYDAGDWAQIRTPLGEVGWVYDQYLQ